MSKNIEIAKSFFVLAQIFGVLAGLIVIAGGASWVSPQSSMETLSTSLEYCQNVHQEINSTDSCLDFIDFNNKKISNNNIYSITLFIIGILIGLFTIIFWWIGHKKIEDPKLNHKKLLTSSLILLIIYIIMIFSISISQLK